MVIKGLRKKHQSDCMCVLDSSNATQLLVIRMISNPDVLYNFIVVMLPMHAVCAFQNVIYIVRIDHRACALDRLDRPCDPDRIINSSCRILVYGSREKNSVSHRNNLLKY